MLLRCSEKGNLLSLMVRLKTGGEIENWWCQSENLYGEFSKSENESTMCDPAISLFGIAPKNRLFNLIYRYLLSHVYFHSL